MYKLLLNIHSILAFLALGTLLANVLNAGIALMKDRPFTEASRKFALFGLIFCHIQLFIGFILFFKSPYYLMLQEGMKSAMQDPMIRKMAIEHPFTNILAIILITIGHSTYKKMSDDTSKYKKIFVFYLLGLLFLMSRIPYAQWLG